MLKVNNSLYCLFCNQDIIIIQGVSGLIRKLIVICIKVYQKWISPLKRPSCRFYPTCSQYALEAVQKYGSLRGLIMAVKRIMKCHPFHPGGYDPVK